MDYSRVEELNKEATEAEDYKNEPEKWNTIKELFGFGSTDKVSVIKAHMSSVEYFVEN